MCYYDNVCFNLDTEMYSSDYGFSGKSENHGDDNCNHDGSHDEEANHAKDNSD